MVGRNLFVGSVLVLGIAATANAQGGIPNGAPPANDPQALEMQAQIQHIMQTRSPEAEAAGRQWLKKAAPNLLPMLDSLHQASREEYWMEIAQAVAQQGMVANIAYYKDSARADVVAKMFGLEANARAKQRAYRTATEASRAAIRKQIEGFITQHFDLEDQLRALEIADIERRLADVRAESRRRRDKRAEFIKFAVDDIIRDAIRPR